MGQINRRSNLLLSPFSSRLGWKGENALMHKRVVYMEWAPISWVLSNIFQQMWTQTHPTVFIIAKQPQCWTPLEKLSHLILPTMYKLVSGHMTQGELANLLDYRPTWMVFALVSSTLTSSWDERIRPGLCIQCGMRWVAKWIGASHFKYMEVMPAHKHLRHCAQAQVHFEQLPRGIFLSSLSHIV